MSAGHTPECSSPICEGQCRAERGTRFSKADERDLERAIAALNRIAARHGEHEDGDWHHYDFDGLSSARSALSEWEHPKHVCYDDCLDPCPYESRL